MTSIAAARDLANFIKSLTNLQWVDEHKETYGHIGAALTDAGLQAGLNYKTVVFPRVSKVLLKWPKANTTSGFLSEISRWGLLHMLDWSHPEKPQRIFEMALILWSQNVETENELKKWLRSSENRERLKNIKGIGPKTIDYLTNLVGGSAIAIDRHLKKFAGLAGISNNDYSELEQIYRYTADLLTIDHHSLDKMIWNYMVEY